MSWQKLKNISPRSHFTQFGKEASDFVNVTEGVLQGSKLGPIAFMIKINMLPSVIEQVSRGVNHDVVDEDTILFMHDTTSWEVLDVHNHGNISKKIDRVKTLPVAAPGLGIWGAFEGQHAFSVGQHRISRNLPSPSLPKFLTLWIFSIHFFRNFFLDLQKLSRPTKIFHGPTKYFSQTYQKCNFLATFHKFLQFCLSNSDVSTTFGHFSQKSPLYRCGSYTHGSQRLMVSTEFLNYQELRGGGAENNLGGGHLPPPPGAATGLCRK